MQVGFGLPVAGAWATPAVIKEIAQRAEALGYSSLWSFTRLLVPQGSPLPPVYWSVLDPVVALGFAAAVTERVRLGTAVVNLPFVAPPVLAKQVATLDVLSGGRADAGLGLGWAPEEFAAVGAPYEGRGRRADEYVACLRALWGPDPVSYEGDLYQVAPSSVLPKPVQSPHPPILLGGTAPASLARAGRIADGWISSSRVDPTQLGDLVGQVRTAAADAGRAPDALRYVCRGVVLDAPRTQPLTGSLDEVRADLPGLAAQGITEVFVDLNFDPTVGHPDVDPRAALRRASAVLEALAPGG